MQNWTWISDDAAIIGSEVSVILRARHTQGGLVSKLIQTDRKTQIF